MSALPNLDSVYSVVTADHPLQGPNLITMNPRALLAAPPKPTANLSVPRGSGTVPLRQRPDEVTGKLRLLIIGDVDSDGVAVADPANQLLVMLDWIETNIYMAIDGATNTVGLSVTGPGGFAKVGRVQWTSFEDGDTDTSEGLTTCRAMLGFTISQRLTTP